MNNNLSFQRSMSGTFQSKADLNYWDTVQKFFDDKQYTDCIRGVIRYLNPELETRFANADKTSYTIPHGSVVVQLDIRPYTLHIRAPLLSVQGAKLVPLLRQIAQINFSPLTIAQIRLENEQLHFQYDCPLDLCEPLKIYDVLREICINADNYDDEFITKFNATRIREPQITPFAPERVDQAWSTTQAYIRETLEAYDQLENKRLNQFLWDILVITLLKIDLLCSPQGNLRNEIEKTIAYLNSKEDYLQRLNGGREFLKKLQAMPKEVFARDLYTIDVFIPYKFFNNLDGIRNNLKYAYETAGNEIKNADLLGATFTLEYGILNLFYSNYVDDQIAEVLNSAMVNASGKPITESAKILFDAVHQVMTSDSFSSVSAPVSVTEGKQGDKKGFFVKLFGL